MLNLDHAVCYDIEVFPNWFVLHMEMLSDKSNYPPSTWEISQYRDDRQALLEWFNWVNQTQTAMIGFNNIHYDYPVIHYIWQNIASLTYEDIYRKSMSIIEGNDRFAHTIWERDRFAPQIDLFKIHHFDNKAKTTSLKALQINMRLPSVVDMPLALNTALSWDDIEYKGIPYVKHDVRSTKQFAHHSMTAMEFRLSLVEQFGVDVMNWNDSKIGSKILENRLGDELCYDRSSGRRVMRQTPRNRIALNDIIFPFIQFQQPEFQRVLNYLKQQTLTPSDLDANAEFKVQKVQTKGVFAGLHAHVGGIEFKFGTGGIHGSVERQIITAGGGYIIRDIDVKALYPSIAIEHGLAPAHLGEPFIQEYARLPEDRAKFQEQFGKKSVQANSMKLASNGTYGNSNSEYSVFYDPQFTMTITVNGQLMLSMLAEWLLTVPTLKIIQINTDGITYYIHETFEPQAAALCRQWEKLTKLKLEDADYRRMFIRDVNSYIAEDMDGKLKQKGAYWHPSPSEYAKSISESQPPAWHKDLGNTISIRAAVMAMVYGIDPATFIMTHTDPYDFMLRIKVNRSDELLWNRQPIQKTSRYYVARQGAPMVKVSPPTKGAQIGAYCRANKIPDALWHQVSAELVARGTPDAHDERIHTKNKSRYQMRETAIQAGYNVMLCNDVADFSFANIDYGYYIEEAKKLIIGTV